MASAFTKKPMKNEKETDGIPVIASSKLGKTSSKNGEPYRSSTGY